MSGNTRSRRAKGGAPIVVVRDRERAALQHPELSVFQRYGGAVYVHTSDPGPLPFSSRYIFNLDRFNERVQGLACEALGHGASVALIVRHVDAALAAFVERATVSLIPAYGHAEHISAGSMKRALHMVCEGTRVVAEGFLRNSVRPDGRTGSDERHPFVQMVLDASSEANASTTVVAAVLAQHRTGSKFLRDLIGWTASANVRAFHEHSVPETTASLDATRPVFDQLALEADTRKRDGLQRAVLRDAILTSERRYIFVTEREPEDRLVSYFVKRRSGWLNANLDAARGSFTNAREIQDTFDRWLEPQVDLQRHWYHDTLVRNFGLDVLRTERTREGVLVGRSGPNTLLVVRSDQLDALQKAVDSAFGPCISLADNSARTRGDEAIDAAFRREIRFDPAAAAVLRSVPEVAHVHRSER